MLFGRAKDMGKVRPDRLAALLNESFDAKLSGFRVRAETLTGEIDGAKAGFRSACEEFGRLDAEPDLEYVASNAATVRKMKDSYVRALLGFDYCEGVSGGINTYDRYGAKLRDTEDFLRKVGEANRTFRPVLSGYSNNLGSFKKAFSAIERSAKALKDELDRRSGERSEYESTLSRIQQLSSLVAALGSEVLMARDEDHTRTGSVEEREARRAKRKELESGLRSKEEAARDAERRLASLDTEAARILGPLARPARKYDHAHASRFRLSDYVTSPVEKLADDSSAYGDFHSTILEISKNPAAEFEESGREVQRSMDSVLDNSFLSLLERIGKAAAERRSLSNDAGLLRSAISGIDKEETAERERAQKAEALRKGIEDAHNAIASTKREIESLFLRHYGIRLEVDVV